MNSSYSNKLDFSEIFKIVTFIKQPEFIVEIGILEGFSLKSISDITNCKIDAYDIFDKFNGNCANYEKLIEKFKENKNIQIKFGDFYKIHNVLEDNSIDILHIDIANDGYTFEFMFKNYINKIKKNGYILLEGGSIERDNTDWMIKYNKPKINTILEKYKNDYNIYTVNNFPSLTIIKHKC